MEGYYMASCMYSKELPDNGDLDNVTGTAPGYKVFVLENDGGISLQMFHIKKDDIMISSGYSVFMNIDETKELIKGMQNAIECAEPKNANHKSRAKDC